MLPDPWSSVHHLLLCSPDSTSSAACRMEGLNMIYQALPQASVQWLLLEPDHYRLTTDVNAVFFEKNNISNNDPFTLIKAIQACHFDAAIILTAPSQSPYQLAYLCYLAGIPIRLGQSQEFGGGVLSHCIQPPLDPVSPAQYILHLLNSAGLIDLHPTPAIA